MCVCESLSFYLYLRTKLFLSHTSPTSTDGQGAAPLAVAPTLGSRGTLQQVARMAGEIHKVIQVELGAIGEAMGRVSRVSTCDGCGNKVYITARIKQGTTPAWRHWEQIGRHEKGMNGRVS